MKIPKIIKRGKRIYIFQKKYPNYFLYKDEKTGIQECFYLSDLIEFKNEHKKKEVKWEK